LLTRAGQAALDRFLTVAVELKADGSEVTEADRIAQAIIVQGLTTAFPGVGVRSEEGAHISGTNGTWYVDPIDGTAAYLEGLAYWGPTVSLVVDGHLVLGAFRCPMTQETWFAAADRGAWRNQARLPPCEDRPLTPRDVIYVPSRAHQRPAMPWPGKTRALGSTAAHLAHTASGGGVASVVARWQRWDVGCGLLLLQESGGEVVDLTGARYDPLAGAPVPCLAGEPRALERLVEIFSA